jgi:cytidylate kinase
VIIAIDGPSGTGKSTVAQGLARRLNFLYFDTGAMYRCFTYFLLQNHIHFENSEAISRALKEFDFDIKVEAGEYQYFLGEKDVSIAIRQEKVSEMASKIAKNPIVREQLLPIQRVFGLKGNVVMEGRDIGTVIFPKANLKIFLIADLEVRTQRRVDQLHQKFGVDSDATQVLKEMEKRDTQDSNRAVAPLKQAKDAIVIDTTYLNADQVISMIIKLTSPFL